MGLEINNAYGLDNKLFVLPANDQTNGVSHDTVLYIEMSTYLAPDTVLITAYDASGRPTPLVNLCNFGTYSLADPTGGVNRPYSDTILQFNAVMPRGTVRLAFDHTGATTPTYVGVWGLNEFSTALANPSTNPFDGTGNFQGAAYLNFFRVQSGPPSPYNDNTDPVQTTQPICPNN